MQFPSVTILLMSLVAGTAVATPLSTRQSGVAGQACTDGRFDGTCREDGRCGLIFPPNETSFQFVRGQCGVAGSNRNNNNNNNAGNNNNNNNNDDEDDNAEDDAASFEGQPCTDGTSDGFCQASGRCGLNIPPNIFSQEFVAGQCGR